MTIGRMIAPVLLAGAMAACSGSPRGASQGGGGANVAARGIDDVLAAHTDSLLALPGVVGTAIGMCEGERCIKVFLGESNPETTGRIPPRLEGYRVVIEVTGTIQPR